MTLTIRLDKNLDKELAAYAKKAGLSKSSVVRESLIQYLEEVKIQKTPWELGKDIFGKYGSGQENLAVDHSRLIKEKLRAKRRSD